MSREHEGRDRRGAEPGALGAMAERLLGLLSVEGLNAEQREALRANLDVVQTTLSRRRAPRVAVVGASDAPYEPLLERLLGPNAEGELAVKQHLGRGRWYDYVNPHGELRMLDLRPLDRPPLDDRPPDSQPAALKALEREAPDELVVLTSLAELEDGQVAGHVARVTSEIEAIYGTPRPVIVALTDPGELTQRRTRRAIELLSAPADDPETSPTRRRFRVVSFEHPGELIRTMVACAPSEARFELATLSPYTSGRREVAHNLVRACSGITATIAAVPLPLADIVPITSIQVTMIATIARLAGREMGFRSAAEFALAMGLNLGTGVAMREVVRAGVRWVPFAGPFLSAGIATTTTYALGVAAINYYMSE